MRIVGANVYEGCWEEEKFGRLVEFVGQHNPDVVGILEANEWDEGRLAELASKTGYEHYFFGQANSDYDLALMSRLPVKADNLPTGFKHTCIKAEIGGVRLFLVHLSPDNEDARLREVEVLLGHIGKNPQRTILMGDMNSLSPADREAYERDGLWQKCVGAGVAKFGETGLRYEVVQKLLDAGLVDVGDGYTTPTPVNVDKYHLAPLRLDYVLVSPDLVSKVQNFAVVRDAVTERMSDHFPVMVVLDY